MHVGVIIGAFLGGVVLVITTILCILWNTIKIFQKGYDNGFE
jgi:hypothetical protein